jgi:hypothetical protein
MKPCGTKLVLRDGDDGRMVRVLSRPGISVRYKPENLFLVGVIPGPREPSAEEVGHFLEPFVDMLDKLWEGTESTSEWSM